MAIDPFGGQSDADKSPLLISTEHQYMHAGLTCAAIRQIVGQWEQPLDENEASASDQWEQATRVIKQLMKASLHGIMFNIASFADMGPLSTADTGIESLLVRSLHDTWNQTWGPPHSRRFLYRAAFTNWLCQCVASDAH